MAHLSPSALRVVMRSAASLIEDHAERLRESCEGGRPSRDWSCDNCPCRRADGVCEGERIYKREIATATMLRDAARNRKLKTE